MGTPVELNRVCVVLFCAAALIWHPCRAAEWAIEPSVQGKVDYNDNYALSPAPHPNVWGIRLSPDVKFSGQTETVKVVGGLNLGFSRYYGESGLDTNDHLLSLRSSYKPERDEIGFKLDSIRDTTLVSELATTGAVLARRPRNLLTASPSWTRSLTETTSITATYAYTNVHYQDTAGTSLIDYRDHSASLGVQSTVDPRKIVAVTAYYDDYQTKPPNFKANTYGVQGGVEYLFSETLRGHATIGVRRTQSTIASQSLICNGPIIIGICFGTITLLTSVKKDNSTGYTLDAGMEKRTETDTVNGQITRDINPSGLGSLIQTDRIQVGWFKQWTDAISTNIGASAYHSQYVGGSVTSSNSRYYTIEPRLTWRVSEWWLVDAGYRYARQSYDNGGVAAAANVVYITVNYVWPRISVSR